MTRLNILLITSDQQHWNTLGCLNPEISTPALDRLAEEGTLYTRAYCPNPTCTPTRSSMITGKAPAQHGAVSLGMKLPEHEPTVGDIFQRAGYRTALVGKAHFQPLQGTEDYPSLEAWPTLQDLDFWRDFNGPFYGFEHIELARNHTTEAHVGQHYALWMEANGLDNWRDFYETPTGNNDGQVRKWMIPERFHYNTWIAERSNALLGQYAENEEPFFLWASFFDPHPKYLAPEPWDTMYDPDALTVPEITPGEHDANPPHFRLTQQPDPDFTPWLEEKGNGLHGCHFHLHDREELAKDIACYYGMVSCMDRYIGLILDRLEELGLADNTLVVFTSDHGHFFGQHGLIAKGPFHYEDMIRVPMILRWPGRCEAGARSDALQLLSDLPVSFLSACGLDVPTDMTAIDQSPVWAGQATQMRNELLVENHHQPTTMHARTLVTERYKLTVYCHRDYGELFDLELDPGETRNLWDDAGHAWLKDWLVERMLLAQMAQEEPLDDERRAWPNKSAGMYTKTLDAGRWRITMDPENDCYELLDTGQYPGSPGEDRWGDPAYSAQRGRMMLALQFARMAAEPFWMPRVSGA
ncbi:MAG: sulfatase-like hydrolase/transferase [Anaerolineaceae bacterium]|nr:sulfatase-like hydrolase/transferase [Anaerolineaceae bacterium]